MNKKILTYNTNNIIDSSTVKDMFIPVTYITLKDKVKTNELLRDHKER